MHLPARCIHVWHKLEEQLLECLTLIFSMSAPKVMNDHKYYGGLTNLLWHWAAILINVTLLKEHLIQYSSSI